MLHFPFLWAERLQAVHHPWCSCYTFLGLLNPVLSSPVALHSGVGVIQSSSCPALCCSVPTEPRTGAWRYPQQLHIGKSMALFVTRSISNAISLVGIDCFSWQRNSDQGSWSKDWMLPFTCSSCSLLNIPAWRCCVPYRPFGAERGGAPLTADRYRGQCRQITQNPMALCFPAWLCSPGQLAGAVWEQNRHISQPGLCVQERLSAQRHSALTILWEVLTFLCAPFTWWTFCVTVILSLAENSRQVNDSPRGACLSAICYFSSSPFELISSSTFFPFTHLMHLQTCSIPLPVPAQLQAGAACNGTAGSGPCIALLLSLPVCSDTAHVCISALL